MAEEVAEKVLAHRGQQALGMELHSLHRVLSVPDSHDHAVLGPGRDLQDRRQGAVEHQRVIAGGHEWLGQPGEDAPAVVVDERRLAVDGGVAPDYPAAVGLSYGLVAMLLRGGRMTPARYRGIQCAILGQMLGIVLLAKGMFYISW